jgi:metallophosphoesterase (TIGR00282 family)
MRSINILSVGDVAGEAGMTALRRELRGLLRFYNIGFTVANGENASNVGITPDQAEELFDCGVNVLTLGNHTWSRREIIPYLDDCEYILRPSNFAPQVPGRGYGAFDAGGFDIAVINLIGRVGMDGNFENPFFEADRILKKLDCKVILTDFHAEATSEKYAMAYYLDGRATALWGTHTHVQTSDAHVFPNGLGYITDLGMTGAKDSILGVVAEQSVSRFLGNPPVRYDGAKGDARIEGAVFEIDADTGKCLGVEAIRIE